MIDKKTRDLMRRTIRLLSEVVDGRASHNAPPGTQYQRVLDVLWTDRQYIPLGAIAFRANCSTAAASARIRDIRRNGYKVERRRPFEGGSHEYRLLGT